MAITFTLSEEEYNLLIQMLVNSNPIIQKIAQQAQPQIAAAAKAVEAAPKQEAPKQPPTSFEARERTERR